MFGGVGDGDQALVPSGLVLIHHSGICQGQKAQPQLVTHTFKPLLFGIVHARTVEHTAARIAGVNDLTPSLRGAVALSALAAVGNLLLAIAHTGVTIPLFSSLGPQGGAVPPAVVAFAVGTTLFTAITIGLLRQHRWAWIAGLVVSALAVLSGVGQFRGVVSAVGIVLAVGLAALLLARPSRRQIGVA